MNSIINREKGRERRMSEWTADERRVRDQLVLQGTGEYVWFALARFLYTALYEVVYEQFMDPELYEASARFVGVFLPLPEGVQDVIDAWGTVECIRNSRLNKIKCLLAYWRSDEVD